MGEEELQEIINDLEISLETCQDDLSDMTQRRDNLSEALWDAVDRAEALAIELRRMTHENDG